MRRERTLMAHAEAPLVTIVACCNAPSGALPRLIQPALRLVRPVERPRNEALAFALDIERIVGWRAAEPITFCTTRMIKISSRINKQRLAIKSNANRQRVRVAVRRNREIAQWAMIENHMPAGIANDAVAAPTENLDARVTGGLIRRAISKA